MAVPGFLIWHSGWIPRIPALARPAASDDLEPFRWWIFLAAIALWLLLWWWAAIRCHLRLLRAPAVAAIMLVLAILVSLGLIFAAGLGTWFFISL
jgi:hypothetical protein